MGLCKRKGSSSKHDFSGATSMLNFGGVSKSLQYNSQQFPSPLVPYSLECQPLWRLDLEYLFFHNFPRTTGISNAFNVFSSKVYGWLWLDEYLTDYHLCMKLYQFCTVFTGQISMGKNWGRRSDGDLSCARSWDRNWLWSWLSPCQSPGTSEDCWPLTPKGPQLVNTRPLPRMFNIISPCFLDD